MNDDERFLGGYAWPVLAAHREFLRYNCLDGGALFHSDPCAHSERWLKPRYSLQVKESVGVASDKAADANLQLTVACELHLWEASEIRTLRSTVADVRRLLESGDTGAFLRASGA